MGRRALLTAAAGLGALPAGATTYGNVVEGLDNWLYPSWEDPRTVNPAILQQVSGLVAEACRVLTGAGIATAVLLVPMKARIYPEFLPADFRWSAASLTAYEALRSGMAEGPAVVPDLAGLFSALRRSQPESLFFKGDTHWTPVAAAATAETLVRALSTRPRLPPNPHGGMTLGRWVPLDFAAADLDLAKQLPEPMRARWKAERYQLRMMPRPTGLLEVEAEGADVTLVGNSYSFPGFGLGANLSEKLARPLNLFARVGREGHWRTMLNYLESSLFRQQRPRLLVWQLIEGSLSLPPDERGFFGDNAMTGDAFLRDLRRLVQPA